MMNSLIFIVNFAMNWNNFMWQSQDPDKDWLFLMKNLKPDKELKQFGNN